MGIPKMKNPITIILLGDIAAGKGTQAKILTKKFKLRLIDTGAYTRKVLTGKSKVSKRLVRVKLGKLAPSDIIQQYLKSQILNLKSHEWVLIDGGKMPAEARLIYRLLKSQNRRPLVVYLSIPIAETFRRLQWRYYCERTGKPLIIKNSSTKCPHCGGRVIKRADDDLQAIKNRLKYYQRIYRQTIKFWQAKKMLKVIRGKQSIARVTKDIVKAINVAN